MRVFFLFLNFENNFYFLYHQQEIKTIEDLVNKDDKNNKFKKYIKRL